MTSIEHKHYDVVIAGARCAGSTTAMLLARAGLRVLVVDPAREGSDTLSTHALMRGAVLQLHNWGLLDAIRDAGTPPIRRTTFHYGDEVLPVDIKPRDGVDALYAPRRCVLDQVLVGAARDAGAEVHHGRSLVGLRTGSTGRVIGATIANAHREKVEVTADLVIGADGVRSKVARLIQAKKHYELPHSTGVIFGYCRDLPLEGYHWYFVKGASAGAIPTNGRTCVFTSVPASDFGKDRAAGLEAVYRRALRTISPELEEMVVATGGPGKMRAFPGIPGFQRESVGPGWALVGDAGFFRDPITAHGISDALREAELLSRAILGESPGGLRTYQAERDARVRGMLEVTDRIASFDWTVEEVKADHLALNREMNKLVECVRPGAEASPCRKPGELLKATA